MAAQALERVERYYSPSWPSHQLGEDDDAEAEGTQVPSNNQETIVVIIHCGGLYVMVNNLKDMVVVWSKNIEIIT